MKDRIFLGGNCHESTWREELIPNLTIDYFNPVVDDWTPECRRNEIDEKENKCNIHLYVITSSSDNVFSIAEAVDSVHNKAVRTIFNVVPDGFSKHQLKHMKGVCDVINSRGGKGYYYRKMGPLAYSIESFSLNKYLVEIGVIKTRFPDIARGAIA